MLPFYKARKLAEAWVDVMSDGAAEIIRDAVQTKRYGWIFHYQRREYLGDPSNFSSQLLGNFPFLVDRTTGEIRILGRDVEQRLAEYEHSLPTIWRQFGLEYPKWD